MKSLAASPCRWLEVVERHLPGSLKASLLALGVKVVVCMLFQLISKLESYKNIQAITRYSGRKMPQIGSTAIKMAKYDQNEHFAAAAAHYHLYLFAWLNLRK
ncbi:hypothetical protein C8J57DRAFT_1228421 [Mycena rebaudengoi]|nr:hypothetical protein C8J57DRAFT_1228421 [Mycena rebaudengoi]